MLLKKNRRQRRREKRILLLISCVAIILFRCVYIIHSYKRFWFVSILNYWQCNNSAKIKKKYTNTLTYGLWKAKTKHNNVTHIKNPFQTLVELHRMNMNVCVRLYLCIFYNKAYSNSNSPLICRIRILFGLRIEARPFKFKFSIFQIFFLLLNKKNIFWIFKFINCLHNGCYLYYSNKVNFLFKID